MDMLPQLRPTESRKTLRPGTLLDHRFVILTLLGRGGLSSVYKAIDLQTDTLVALKVQDVSWQNTELTTATLHELFRHEARMLRHLHHTPVAQYQAAQLDHTPFYLAISYVHGTTLATLLEQEPLTLAAAIELSLAITAAVEQLHAHRPRVVHGDLKPENILITPGGKVVIIDLGTARWLGLDMPHMPRMLTEAYAAPEQQMGAKVDQRADQYALSVIIEAIVGEANVPGAIRCVLDHASAVLPYRRYSSLAAFHAALQTAVEETLSPTLSIPWWLRVLIVVVALVLLRLLIAYIAV
jgi:tRNA A-37 threonylcarbamoyl transferase component Bud32